MYVSRLIIEGNTVYEIDEECLKKKQMREEGTKERKQQIRNGYSGKGRN